MKELLKSKMMIGFVMLVLGVVYINSVSISSEVSMAKEETKIENIYNK